MSHVRPHAVLPLVLLIAASCGTAGHRGAQGRARRGGSADPAPPAPMTYALMGLFVLDADSARYRAALRLAEEARERYSRRDFLRAGRLLVEAAASVREALQERPPAFFQEQLHALCYNAGVSYLMAAGPATTRPGLRREARRSPGCRRALRVIERLGS